MEQARSQVRRGKSICCDRVHFRLHLQSAPVGENTAQTCAHIPIMRGMNSYSNGISSFISKGASVTLTSLFREELLRVSVLLVQDQLFLTLLG